LKIDPFTLGEGSNGVWRDSSGLLPMNCRFSRSDTSSYNDPAKIFYHILKEFGISDDFIDETSVINASASFTGYSPALTANGGYVKQHNVY